MTLSVFKNQTGTFLYFDKSTQCNVIVSIIQYRYLVLNQTEPQPQPWQSKIVAGNKDDELYSQQLFYSARAGGLSCLVKDQISIL